MSVPQYPPPYGGGMATGTLASGQAGQPVGTGFNPTRGDQSSATLAGSVPAQQALWARLNGIDLSQPINEFGRVVLGQFRDVVQPWMGAMMLSGNRTTQAPDLMAQIAQRMQGTGFADFLEGGVNEFLNNPTLTNAVRQGGARGAAQLESILGLRNQYRDPIFEQIANQQFSAGQAGYGLANAEGRLGGNSNLYDFLATSPQWSWMVGR